jgi:hypothetical protein
MTPTMAKIPADMYRTVVERLLAGSECSQLRLTAATDSPLWRRWAYRTAPAGLSVKVLPARTEGQKVTFQPPFFEISAQLVPVLFLALVVEDKLQPDEDESAFDRVIRTWAIALLVVAGVVCMAVLAGAASPSEPTGRTVSVCLLLAGLLIVKPVLASAFADGQSHWEQAGHAGAGLLLVTGAVVLAVVLAV